MSLLTLLKRMNSGETKWVDPARNRPITAHGFRATFRTWAGEVATFPHDVIEQAMGHQVGTKVDQAYNRSDVFKKRQALMEAWAQWCEPRTGNVIAFGKGGGRS
jgi:integrase